MSLLNKIKLFTQNPPDEKPINWLGFTEGVYVSLYVVLLLYGIEILAELTKELAFKESIDSNLEVMMLKVIYASMLMFIFCYLHIKNLRRNKKAGNIRRR